MRRINSGRYSPAWDSNNRVLRAVLFLTNNANASVGWQVYDLTDWQRRDVIQRRLSSYRFQHSFQIFHDFCALKIEY